MTDASLHDAYAAEYDSQVRAYGSHIHDALFGLGYAYLQAGQRLLDIGAGTGLSSELFARAGLRVDGMDFSPAMLAEFRSKGFALELTQHDLQQTPWPLPDGRYQHALACGVFHFIPDLQPIFAETRRVLAGAGTFLFTTRFPNHPLAPGVSYEQDTVDKFKIFSHSSEHIEGLLVGCGFARLKMMRAFVGPDVHCLWVAQAVGMASDS